MRHIDPITPGAKSLRIIRNCDGNLSVVRMHAAAPMLQGDFGVMRQSGQSCPRYHYLAFSYAAARKPRFDEAFWVWGEAGPQRPIGPGAADRAAD